MKIVYSWHGKEPSSFTKETAELSILSVKNFCPQYTTELWVDHNNYGHFKHLPYDNIVISDFGRLASLFWNLSKMYVYAQQEGPFLHIDFDTCAVEGFEIPKGDIICEKRRDIDTNDANLQLLYELPVPSNIICSGMMGGCNYGSTFKDHYEWALQQSKSIEDPTYWDMITIEEVAMTQLVNFLNVKVASPRTDTFLHFWCREEFNKEEAYGQVVHSLLQFNRDVFYSKHGKIYN